MKQGHEVFVLAGEPSYERELWLKEGGKVDEVRNGVKVHRVKTVPRGKGVIRRVRNYYSYAINSKRYVKKLDKDFDVVFVYGLSPIMMAEAAIKYKKKYGTKVVLYCLDLWPKSLTAGRRRNKRGRFHIQPLQKVIEENLRGGGRTACYERVF